MLRKAAIHLVLLAGCALFAFPFVWLLGTSFKADTEVFVFPPKWIPRVPTYSVKSPFVSDNVYDAPLAPELLPGAEWARVWPEVQTKLWEAGPRELGAAWARVVGQWPNHESLREQMTRGLWEQISALVPDRVFKDPSLLPEFASRAVTADFALTVWKKVRRVFALGTFNVRNLKNDAVPPSPASDDDWKPWNDGVFRLTRGRIVGEPKGAEQTLVTYDLAQHSSAKLTRTLRLPLTCDEISGMSLPLHTDESWHRLEVTLESGGKVFRSQRPLFLDLWTAQEANWTFQPPTDRNTRTIYWEPVPAATTDVTDTHTYRFTIELVRSSPLRAAAEKYFDNYRWAVRYVPFWSLMANSFYLVFMNVVGQILACSLVAYAFARLRWFGRDVLFAVLLATMMVPNQVTEIPRFVLIKWLGWYNTLRPLWVGSWFGGAFFIFLLRQFFLSIPKDLDEAAKIDGCSYFGIWWRIMLPLVKPALATVAIFQFMNSWNDFMGPLIYISDERQYPLSYGLYMFRSEHTTEMGMLMAASTIMVLPVVMLFFFCQRYFIQGTTLTGLKQ